MSLPRPLQSRPRPQTRPLGEVERHLLRTLPRLTEQGLLDLLTALRHAERRPAEPQTP